MVNKTIKAVVAALIMLPGGSVLAYGNSVQTCGNAAGNNVKVSGNVGCQGQANASLTRKRGDKVAFSQNVMKQFDNAEQIVQGGGFIVPAAGSYAYYKLGTIKVLIGTFNLNADNSKAPAALQTIIRDAKANHSDANSMIWFGRALAGETAFTEIAETYSDATNPAGDPIRYEKTGPTSVKVFAPNQDEPIVVDMSPIR